MAIGEYILGVVRSGIALAIRGVRVRVRGGPNKGLWWSAATTGRGYGKGTFEARRIETIATLVREGECFWDIGAHKGYVSLVAARRIGETGRVYAFEPARVNLWFLRKHLVWNAISRVRVMPLAVSDFDGESCFGGGSSLSFRLGGGGERVRVWSIKALLESGGLPQPTFIKIDVEGAEMEVLRGAGEHLFAPDRCIMVATHSKACYVECKALLHRCGFRLVESGEVAEIEARGWQGRGDPDILAIGPERKILDEDLKIFLAVGTGGQLLNGFPSPSGRSE